MTILKYPLESRFGLHTVIMPSNAQVLSVENQREIVTLWASVALYLHKAQPRSFYVATTGENIPYPDHQLKFIGTVLLSGGDIVAHVLEVVR